MDDGDGPAVGWVAEGKRASVKSPGEPLDLMIGAIVSDSERDERRRERCGGRRDGGNRTTVRGICERARGEAAGHGGDENGKGTRPGREVYVSKGFWGQGR